MAGSVNKVILVGNVGADPEIRQTNSGQKIANIRLATSETWKDKRSGERQEKTEWHTVVVFAEGTAGFIEEYVHKGDKLYVEGQLQTRKWKDKDDNDRYSTEVVVQGFGGKVEIVSSKNGGGGRDDDDDDRGSRRSSRDSGRSSRDDRGSRGSRDDDRGRDEGRSRDQGGREFGRSAPSSSRFNDLDDDIPF